MELFKDKDKFNHKRITASGFAQVVQLIGCHMSKDDIDVLCGYYNDPQNNFVDYPKFVEDVDNVVGLIFGDRAATSIVAKPIPTYNCNDSEFLILRRDYSDPKWEEIKANLQSYIFKRRIRIEDFFLSFDNLRSGKVTDQKFRSVVGQLTLPLDPDQIDFLIEMFRAPGTNDMVDYRTFVHQLNKIFGKRELCKKPVDKGKPRTTASPDPSKTFQSLQYQEQSILDQILARMRYIIKTRRMNIKDQFEDYDRKPHKNYITKQQFKQCIARLGLSSDPKEFAILCKNYRCTEYEDMNYRQFCDDVDVIDVPNVTFSS